MLWEIIIIFKKGVLEYISKFLDGDNKDIFKIINSLSGGKINNLDDLMSEIDGASKEGQAFYGVFEHFYDKIDVNQK